jgi:hypothetical protein
MLENVKPGIDCARRIALRVRLPAPEITRKSDLDLRSLSLVPFALALPFASSPQCYLTRGSIQLLFSWDVSLQVLWEIDRAEIDWEGSIKLGAGAFGEVVRAKWRGTPVAVKKGE